MLGIEWDNFEKLDNQEYIVKKNPKFLSQYNSMVKKGFNTILDLDEIQELINNITYFYEFKYSSQMLDNVGCIKLSNNKELASCIELSKKLDMKQLQYRLYENQLNFLECSYDGDIIISKESNNNRGIPIDKYFQIDATGKISKYALMSLKESRFLDDIEGISNIEDLYEVIKNNTYMIEYDSLERHINNHKDSINLRNETLNLVMLNLLYKGNHPTKGYIRAKSFMRMFNKEYQLNLTMKKLDDIMRIDYSNTEEVKRLIKSRS